MELGASLSFVQRGLIAQAALNTLTSFYVKLERIQRQLAYRHKPLAPYVQLGPIVPRPLVLPPAFVPQDTTAKAAVKLISQ